VLVAIPGYGATALGNVQTGVAASALSLGFAFDIEKSGNNMQIDVDSTTSACVILMGAINSATSEIEVAFTVNSLLLPPLDGVPNGF